jgi:hypothetical protein
MPFTMNDLTVATTGVASEATVHVSVGGAAPIPVTGAACNSADVLLCAVGRRLYLVRLGSSVRSAGEGHLLVIADSPEGAASFLQLRLRDMYDDGDMFLGEYIVRPMAADVGCGIWLSGYDRSDDLDAVLDCGEAPEWDRTQLPLWGAPITVVLRRDPP